MSSDGGVVVVEVGSEAQVVDVPLMVDLGRHSRRCACAAAMGNWRFGTAIVVSLKSGTIYLALGTC